MKYKLTDNTKIHEGTTLYQIEALKDFNDVKRGQLGGFVQVEKNLSQEGNCWIYDQAIARDNAYMRGQAVIKDSVVIRDFAIVWNNTVISDFAKVSGNGVISDFAKVSGNAVVRDDAHISGQAMVTGYTEVGGRDIVNGTTHLDFDEVNKRVYLNDMDAYISENAVHLDETTGDNK